MCFENHKGLKMSGKTVCVRSRDAVASVVLWKEVITSAKSGIVPSV